MVMKIYLVILLIALSNVFSSTTAQNTITQGLVAYYPFNGNATDESGNLNNGTVYSATLTTDRFGIENRAFNFNGNGNYIEVPSSPTLTFSNTFSLCAFVSVDNFQHSAPIKQQAIISKIVDGNWYGGYELMAGGDGIKGLFASTTNINGSNFAPEKTGFLENQWYFVCSVYDGNNFTLYVNGSIMASSPATGQIQTSNIPLRMGRRGGAGFYNCYFKGKIDDVRIYNRALSNTEIQQLYNDVNTQVPTFSAIAPICRGATLSALPTTSNNNIVGTWSPTLDNLNTTTYTFTPNNGQNATSTNLTITVSPKPTAPTINAPTEKVVCYPSTLTLTATACAGTVSWSNGSLGTSLTLSTTGTYSLSATCTVDGCTSDASLAVSGLEIKQNSTVPAQGLVAYYPFNGNANDVSGNDLNGIVTRATLTTDRKGNSNNAYDFDFINASFGQQNDEIYIPFKSTLNVTNITVSVWLYPRSYYWGSNPGSSIIINRFQYTYSTPSGGSWELRFDQNSVQGTIFGTPNGIGTATSNTSLQLNTWHHIVMTYDGNQIKLYINGNLSATQSYSQPMNIVGNSGICIGESNQANGFWYHTDGKIDDIGIWNRALSNTEIQQLYNDLTNCNTQVPTFNAIAPICRGATLSALPTTSNNNIVGTWSPTLDNLNTTTYTFTPNNGQNATSTNLTITVNPKPTAPTINAPTEKVVCYPSTLTLTATACAGTVSWSNGSLGTSLTLSTTGTYSLSATCTVDGCTSDASLAVSGLEIKQNSTVPAQGLVAYYPFNGNANDVSGNDLNGIVTRATLTTDRKGNSNNAYDFDFINASFGQQNDEIYIPFKSTLNVTNITVSVWLYPRSYYWSGDASNPNSTILNRYQYTYSTSSGAVWGIYFNENSVSAIIVASTHGTAKANQALQLNSWHHVVMTYDGVDVKLFINGNLSATQSFSQPMNITGNSGISIGESNQANGFWSHTDGKIDDIGIWNRALSNTEIQQLYNDVTNCNTQVPTFSAIAPICRGATLSALPTTSNNNIVGTWSPTLDNLNTTTYTFTPNNGQNASPTNLTITVNPKPTAPTINAPTEKVVCYPSTLTLTATAYAGTVSWSNGSLGTSLTLSTTGTYSLSATCTVDGCISDASSSITGLEIKTKPTALTINAPFEKVVCSPSTLTLTSSGCAGTVTWSNGSLGISLTLSTVGTYSVSAICAVNGCTSDVSSSVTGLEIKTRPNVPTINAPIEKVVCFPSTLTLSATACAGTVTWSNGSSGTSLTLSTVGTYSVSAICAVNGCTSDVSSSVIGLEIKAKPNVPTINAPTEKVVCFPSTLTLTATACAGTVIWSNGSLGTSLTLSTTGTYSLSAICTANGCTSDASSSVTGLEIKTKPTAPTINAPTEKVVCFPSTLTLSATACAGTVTWSNGSLGTSLTLSAVGTYSVSAICTVNGCTSDESLAVNGLEIKVTPYALASNTGPFTAGQTILLNASGGSVTPPSNYAWTGPNGFFSSISNPTIENATSANGGIYNLTVSLNGCSATATTIVVVGNLASISIPSITETEFCAGSNLTINFSATGTFNVGNQFQVQLSDANGNFNSPQIIGTANAAGSVLCNIPTLTLGGENYRIKVVSTNPAANGNFSSVALTVNPSIHNLVNPTNNLNGTGIKKAVDSINASNKIIFPANVVYQAGKSVLLTPGFESGAVFRAEIKSCDN
jgi:hypothetical protein